MALKALLRGAISVGTSTNDNRVKRLLVCLVPKTAGTITVVDVITNATNTPVWHDTTDPSKTYITVGTKGKKGTGWMDDYEIKLPHAGYYDILFIANPTDVVATKVKTAAYPAFLNDVLFSDTYPFTDADRCTVRRVRMMSRVYYNQYIGQGTYEAPFGNPSCHQAPMPSSSRSARSPCQIGRPRG